MSWMRRMLTRGRVRTARRKLAQSPSILSYAQLAREHARLGDMQEVLRVCGEGLDMFPGNPELLRLADRAAQLEREDRTRELYRELREAPRPALWRELCEILIRGGRFERAEECAREWYAATRDGQALLMRARSRVGRFLDGRHREDGRVALELCEAAARALPREQEPLRLRLKLISRIGAWKEARRVVSQLLEMVPGEPALEARFRTLLSLSEGSPTPEEALLEVEKTGRLVDDEPGENLELPQDGSIRPRLQELASEEGVNAAIYVRGGTALVQGPRGATADRAARAVREMVHSSRTAARRLGLGQAIEVRLEGEFGTLMVSPGELGSGALWCNGQVLSWHEQALAELTGDRPSVAEASS